MSNSEKPTGTELEWIKSEEGIAEIYANTFHLTWSLYDIRVRLGHLVPRPEHAAAASAFVGGASEETAALTFPWGMAKGIRDQLSELIKRYEDKNGEIKPVQLP